MKLSCRGAVFNSNTAHAATTLGGWQASFMWLAIAAKCSGITQTARCLLVQVLGCVLMLHGTVDMAQKNPPCNSFPGAVSLSRKRRLHSF